ncbi:esterase-like activity of phytase family protein [Roseomonas sp. HJA6]|uniref:Esterase-like activity of phytase family protein n=1 Tax=Roseomonas alba TaxID=2846776 RepID=A0ABS7AE28_9PROT|nr:esterase-like activity of phytase family protein [Neoroseomonas alba]MBW6400556.1 esterase-like activity of phytase family protein [Neoroseomonas alba]
MVCGGPGAGKALPRRAVLAAALATTGCIYAAPTPPPGGAAAILPPIPTTGPLRSLGGLDIDNAILGAGGLSGLHLDRDLVVTVLDDRTRWAQAQLVLRDGVAAGLVPITSGALHDGAGVPLPVGFAGDAEGLARLPDGTWLVAYERWHRIRAYPHLDGAGEYFEAPPGLDAAPRNGGLESLTLLADGRLFAVAEELAPADSPGLRRGWIGGPGRWAPLTYRPTPGFVPVDAAGLPDGGALVLERRFRWYNGFAGRLKRLPAEALRPGAALEGREILRMDGKPVPAENFEGVAALSHEGRTLVAIVSDDNHMPNQRSLMLLFELTA